MKTLMLLVGILMVQSADASGRFFDKTAEGLRISQEAEKTMDLKTSPVKDMRVPRSAVVSSRNESFIFVQKKGRYLSLRVEVSDKEPQSDFVRVQSNDLRDGDRVVSSGVAYLRVTEIFSEQGPEPTHE